MKKTTMTVPIRDFEAKAKQFAYQKHAMTNHQYDGKPYSVHLDQCFDLGLEYAYYVEDTLLDNVLAAIWLHDVQEDCRVNYNEIKKEFNEVIAELSYAVRDEKGRTRKERHNKVYYAGIRAVPYATFIKLCDRIANMEYSQRTGSSMYKTYASEHEEFYRELYDGRFQNMWDHLCRIVDEGPGTSTARN
jgi:(p)ppGpp synthase/HD superfamily hydrolase